VALVTVGGEKRYCLRLETVLAKVSQEQIPVRRTVEPGVRFQPATGVDDVLVVLSADLAVQRVFLESYGAIHFNKIQSVLTLSNKYPPAI
jgi:hypothetical protein